MTPPPDADRSARDARLGPLLVDMRDSLRSEFGARTVYPLLARFAKDEELRGVLHTLHAEECRQVDELRALMKSLGADPASRSLRRVAMAWLLFMGTPVLGLRFALRLCLDAESRVARWYHGYAAWFADHGMGEAATKCAALSDTKRTHAQVLEAFVEHSPGRFR